MKAHPFGEMLLWIFNMIAQVWYKMCSVTSSGEMKVDFRGNCNTKWEPGRKELSQSIKQATDKLLVWKILPATILK